MTTRQLSGTTAIVTGASRGFGRGIAAVLTQAGAGVVGVARDAAALDEVREHLGGAFTPVAADAAGPVVAGQLIDAHGDADVGACVPLDPRGADAPAGAGQQGSRPRP